MIWNPQNLLPFAVLLGVIISVFVAIYVSFSETFRRKKAVDQLVYRLASLDKSTSQQVIELEQALAIVKLNSERDGMREVTGQIILAAQTIGPQIEELKALSLDLDNQFPGYVRRSSAKRLKAISKSVEAADAKIHGLLKALEVTANHLNKAN